MIFPKWANSLPLVLFGALAVVSSASVFALWYWGSDKHLIVGYTPEQPIAYSHRLHVNELGLDCRYCHYNVEKSPSAGVPPTEVCMNCHSIIKTESVEIQKLKGYHEANLPVPWERVHKLPEYAYFDHSAHVNKGVGCVECHGRVDHMVEVRHEKSLSMMFCLECHRDPAPNLREKSLVTRLSWTPEGDKREYGEKFYHEYQVQTRTDCSTCHR